MSKRIQTLAPFILKDYRERKLSLRELEKKYDICAKTVYNLLKKENLPTITKPKRIIDLLQNKIVLPIEDIKEMYLEGYSYEQIARAFYVSSETVRNALFKIGVDLQFRINYRKEQVKKLYQDKKLSIEDIANIIGVESNTISMYARQMGIHKKTDYKIRLDTMIGREKFIRVYNNCKTYRQISQRFGISELTVRNYSELLNLKLKPSKRYIINDDNKEEFIEMYNNKDNLLSNIALHFNTSVNVIRNSAKRFGLLSRREKC